MLIRLKQLSPYKRLAGEARYLPAMPGRNLKGGIKKASTRFQVEAFLQVQPGEQAELLP